MPQQETLKGLAVLVVENEWLIADDIRRELTREGAHVLGPVASVDQALALIAGTERISAAVLDIHLGEGSSVYLAAEALQVRGVPFLFATGYDHFSIRRDFADAPNLIKPFAPRVIGPLLATLAADHARAATC